jgi:hypothetical protein
MKGRNFDFDFDAAFWACHVHIRSYVANPNLGDERGARLPPRLSQLFVKRQSQLPSVIAFASPRRQAARLARSLK